MHATWHNRWHPDITPAGVVEPGQTVTLETRDSTDGIINSESTHSDLTRLDLSRAHQLTGPYYVAGAEPGDLLEVELLEISTENFGYTAIFPGFGALADLFPTPYLLKWKIEEGFARSSQLPGVALPKAAFAGVVGVSPSQESMASARQQDQLVRTAGGTVTADQPGGAVPKIGSTGLRTTPPRAFGGNLDIRQLQAGAKLFLPVQVPGALLSVGDLHFAQGDGEVCGSAIECAGSVSLRVKIVRDARWQPRMPTFMTPGEPQRPMFATTGTPSEVTGSRPDLTSAVQVALIEMLDYLCATHGFEREAAYGLMSVAVDLRLSEIVNLPNPLVSALLPLDIFAK